MGKEVPLSLNEREFILQALTEGKRIDGRDFLEHRPIEIHFGKQLGNVEVTLGRTRIHANVSAEIVPPYADRPTEGFLHFNAELTPMASPAYESNRLSTDEVLLTRMLDKTLKRSRALDTEGLCILSGRKVWSIRVDIHALDHDGNLIDAASIAAITALLHFRRPDVTVHGEEVTVHAVDQKHPVPLSIHHIPICMTFAFYEQDVVVLDPGRLEQAVQAGDLTVAVNQFREVCALTKAGGLAVDMHRIVGCCDLAYTKATAIIECIQKRLQEDQVKRQVKQGGLVGRKE